MFRVNIYIFVLFYTGFLSSQERLTAESAIEKALENNYQIQIAGKQEEIAEKNNKWSEAGAFPTVELSTMLGNSVIDNRNNPFTFTPGLLANNQITPGVLVNWNLFSGMGVVANKRRLEKLEEQTKGNGLLIIENTIHEVLTAYYGAVVQKERLHLLEDLLNVSRKSYQYEENKMDYGQSNRLALFQLKNQYLSDSLNLLQQEINYQNSLRNLLLIMNEDSEKLINDNFPELTDSLAIDTETISLDAVVNDMQQNNQNLKNQQINIELQEALTKQQKSFLYPVVNLQLGANPNVGSFRFLGDAPAGFPESIQTQQVTYFGNVNIRYNLFDNWKNKRAVEVSKIQEEIAALNVDELKKQLTVNAANLVKQYEIRSKLLGIARENKHYAKLAFEVGQERFELGGINSLELAQLQNAYMTAGVELFDTQYQKLEVYFELLKLTGKFQLMYQR